MDVANDPFGLAVGDFYQAVVYFGRARRIKGVGVEIKRTGLECGLEDVGDIGEQDVVKQVAKLDG